MCTKFSWEGDWQEDFGVIAPFEVDEPLGPRMIRIVPADGKLGRLGKGYLHGTYDDGRGEVRATDAEARM